MKRKRKEEKKLCIYVSMYCTSTIHMYIHMHETLHAVKDDAVLGKERKKKKKKKKDRRDRWMSDGWAKIS